MKNARQSGSQQVDSFVKAAHALGCDESEERFDAALRQIAKHKPPDPKPAKPKKPKPAK